MSEENPLAMSDEERDAFLGDGGTGVLSLASGEEPPHSVPVSYGYDATTETFYFRLAAGGGGSKGELADRAVTFVTYGKGETWQSVVAKGRLEDVESAGIETETLAGLDHVEIPLVDLFERPLREVTFEFYRLVPEAFTGRVEAESR